MSLEIERDPGFLLAPPGLLTRRLRLRAFELTDAAVVQQLASERVIADTTITIPHPYTLNMAEAWILTHKPLFRTGAQINFAITRMADQQLVGAIGLRVQPAHNRAELGYWIGVPYWGQGYCTEAARAVLAFGFDELHLHRIHAAHLRRNPASGRVLQKCGMVHEGCAREHAYKWDRYEDLEQWGIMRPEYEQQKALG